jgi:REP element-mobilizing transposase RayT
VLIGVNASPWLKAGYFVATCGGATLEVIKRYVENQRKA